jgi:hypothetical protein
MSVRRKIVCIHLTTQRLNFWLQLSARLNETLDVILLGRADIRKIADRDIPKKFKEFVVFDLYMSPTPPAIDNSVLIEAARIEAEYGVKLSLILSTFRDLGKGYIFNADCHPDMGSANWSHEHKLNELICRFRFWEGVCDHYKPVLIIGESNMQPLTLIAKSRGILDVGLGFIKHGERYFWTENIYYQNNKYKNNIKFFLEYYAREDSIVENNEYPPFAAANYLDSKVNNKFRRALKDVLMRLISESLHQLKRLLNNIIRQSCDMSPGYRYLGWVMPQIRRPFIYRHIQKFGVRPSDLARYKVIYVPMHLEPEIALGVVSPEFNNTMEMVSLLSKTVPSDYIIVLKENINALGIRSKRYYDQLRKIGNVTFANMEISSWDWIKSSEFVATITGTAAIEAVHFLKPVLSFGKHQVVNLLPTVRLASDYETVSRGVEELRAISKNFHLLNISRAALNRAQIESSFNLAGSARLYDRDFDVREAVVGAFSSLKAEYPEVFS